MARSPDADITVSPELVQRLIEEQHPELAGLPIELVANGWDNAIYRLGADLVVRVPRREVAASLIRNEQRWLPAIAERVHLAVPRPLRLGTPTPWFPWHWTISTWFDGTVAASVPRGARANLAEPLAQFLTDLHIPAPADAPHNPFRGVPLALRDSDMSARLASGLVPHPTAVADRWRRALAASRWDGEPMWLHGDLHPANLLVARGELGAVLDFGDLTAGDPATDLSAAWLIFDRTGRERLQTATNAQRTVTTETWLRAQGWALVLGTALVVNSDDSPTFRRMGEEIIDEVLAD
jgi:aminoglycoside phosphotransferase (APT) family kinase protein